VAIGTVIRKTVMRSLSPVIAIYKHMNVHSLLAMAGMAGPLLLIATDLTAAFSNPGYSLVRDSISSLALANLGWLQTIGFLFIGLLVEIFTAGLLFNVKRTRGFHLGIGLMVFFGFAMLIIGAFRTDPVGAARTIEGRIHGLAATSAFWIFPAAILALAPSLWQDPRWKGIFLYTVIAGILAVPLVITLGVLKDDISWFGLLERIVVANMIIWVEVAAIRLLLLSFKWGRPAQDTEKGHESSPSLS
jgi:MFS family permease